MSPRLHDLLEDGVIVGLRGAAEEGVVGTVSREGHALHPVRDGVLDDPATLRGQILPVRPFGRLAHEIGRRDHAADRFECSRMDL